MRQISFSKVVLLLILSVLSCKDDKQEVIPEPQIAFLEGSSTNAFKAETIFIKMSLTSSAGVKTFTVNGVSIDGWKDQNQQDFTFEYKVPGNPQTNIIILNFSLVDNQNQSFEIDYTVNIAEDNFVLNDNLVVLNEEAVKLVSDSSELVNGHYEFEIMGTLPDIGENDIIIGQTGEGFLRKVTKVESRDDNLIVLQTNQATLDEVFLDGKLSLDLSSEGAIGGRSFDDVFKYSVTNEELFNNGSFKLILENGSLEFDPNMKLEYDPKNGNLLFELADASLISTLDLHLQGDSKIDLNKDHIIATDSRRLVFFAGIVPIVVTIETKLVASLNIALGAMFSSKARFSSNSSINSWISYENGSWSDFFEMSNDFSIDSAGITGAVAIDQLLEIRPELSVKLYGIAGPFAKAIPYEKFNLTVASPSLDWVSTLDTGINLEIGADVDIFGEKLADYTIEFEGSKENLWTAPDALSILSGDSQVGAPEVRLNNPIILKVTDNLAAGVPYVPVHFEVLSGGGSINETSTISSENGVVEVVWTLGSESDNQTIGAEIRNSTGEVISRTEVTAVSEETEKEGSFVDIRDGHVYKTIIIGSQKWTAENLNYEITPGSACYADVPANCDNSGRLYTYEAALKACPEGWKLPSDHDWQELLIHLGMSASDTEMDCEWGIGLDQAFQLVEGGSSGFNALLAGTWESGFGFESAGETTFWSSTSFIDHEDGEPVAWTRTLNLTDESSFNEVGILRCGDPIDGSFMFYCRCIKKE